MTRQGIHFFMRLLTRGGMVAVMAVAVIACSPAEPTVLLKAEPAEGETVTASPGSLRLYFSARPLVDKSSLRLEGPSGEENLVGLHTMGADDLMVGIDQYPLANGSYTVHWTVAFSGDDREYTGNYQFTVAIPQE